MKRAILALLIVAMVSTPCLAEVEPESIFSVNGTLWGMYEITTQITIFSNFLSHFFVD